MDGDTSALVELRFAAKNKTDIDIILHISHPASEEDAAVIATEPGHAAAQPRPRHAAYGHQDLGAHVPQPEVHVILVPGPETANIRSVSTFSSFVYGSLFHKHSESYMNVLVGILTVSL